MGIVMVEEDNDVLETETPKEGEEGGSFVGKITNQISQIKTKISEIEFTTTLLIKIAIGFLTVLLIALALYFFMPKEEASSEAVEQESTTEEAEDGTGDESEAGALSEISGELAEGEVTSDLSGAIEGNVTTAAETQDLAVDVNLKDASGAENAALAAVPKSDNAALEMFKLREQVLMLEDENRRLKQRVNTLQAQADMSDEPRKTSSPKTRKSEQESMPQPTWGDFEPLHQGP
jgi:cytoskeletal protein RodZ